MCYLWKVARVRNHILSGCLSGLWHVPLGFLGSLKQRESEAPTKRKRERETILKEAHRMGMNGGFFIFFDALDLCCSVRISWDDFESYVSNESALIYLAALAERCCPVIGSLQTWGFLCPKDMQTRIGRFWTSKHGHTLEDGRGLKYCEYT